MTLKGEIVMKLLSLLRKTALKYLTCLLVYECNC